MVDDVDLVVELVGVPKQMLWSELRFYEFSVYFGYYVFHFVGRNAAFASAMRRPLRWDNCKVTKKVAK